MQRKTDDEMIADWTSRAARSGNGPACELRRKAILRHLVRCGQWVTVPVSGISAGTGSAKTRDATILSMINAKEAELQVSQLMSGERILTLRLATPAPAA